MQPVNASVNPNNLSPRSKTILEDDECIYVVTRKGNLKRLDPHCITQRIRALLGKQPAIRHVNADELTINACSKLVSGISTFDIDEYIANMSASGGISNPQLLKFAARIAIDNHQKNAIPGFVAKMRAAYERKDGQGKHSPLLNKAFMEFIEAHASELESYIDYERDFNLDFFGFRTFQKLYAIKIAGRVIECPQDMFMRTAVSLHMPRRGLVATYGSGVSRAANHLVRIKNTYDQLSLQYYTQASPTYFNAGTNNEQFASCFLMGTHDSRKGIMKTADDASVISKWGGGVGIHIHCWRSCNKLIRGTNGVSSGVVPFLKIYNDVMRAFNQGGKRMGSAAIYLNVYHPDIIPFLNLRRNAGSEDQRARDLFYAVWVPDLFMRRVAAKGNEMFSLFDPDDCPQLQNLYGEEFEKEYLRLEEAKMYIKQLPAKQIWEQIYITNKETGMPYVCFSDTVNRLSNQSNIGPIHSSNLCVTGESRVLTTRGYVPIRQLAESNNGIHQIWNGAEFSRAVVSKTGENRPLIRLRTKRGKYLHCTPEHHMLVVDRHQHVRRVAAGTLRVGDQLLTCQYPTMQVVERIEELNQQISSMLDFYIETDDYGYHKLVCISRSETALHNLRETCNQLGADLEITEYEARIWFGRIDTADACNLYNYGLSHKRDVWTALTANNVYAGRSFQPLVFKNSIATEGFIARSAYPYRDSIENVEPIAAADTYCFNEPLLHSGVIDGVLTGNCSEIVEYSDAEETAVCNLSSISLAKCVCDTYTASELEQPASERRQLDHEFPLNPVFDFKQLLDTTKKVASNLNRVIDITFYPTPETERSNLRHRPIGIGVQGLADCFLKLRYPFDSEAASALNKRIFETIYYAALTQSTMEAREIYLSHYEECKSVGLTTIMSYDINENYKRYGSTQTEYTDPEAIPKTCGAYSTFLHNGGCPLSKGIFHWEAAGLTHDDLSGMWDWDTLRSHIRMYGVRNSLLVAIMPTASTSQLMGNNECIEPYTSQIYRRITLAGDYVVINKYLIRDLYEAKLWTPQLKDYLIQLEGSIQNIDGIPDEMKALYKTAWEIDQSVLIKLAAERQPFVDQAQSLNLYIETMTLGGFNKLMFQAWRSGLKTGKYYVHSRAAVSAPKFTIDATKLEEMKRLLATRAANTSFMDNVTEVCDLCSS